jgi:hypothetical protein
MHSKKMQNSFNNVGGLDGKGETIGFTLEFIETAFVKDMTKASASAYENQP